ncbi:MAG: primosomal protein N', partial [Akkermansiaceae bacterium]
MNARVLIDGPSELVFDYAIPAELPVVEGCRVRVPIRQKTSSGTVLAILEPPKQSEFAMREIQSLIDPEPLITPTLLKVARWIANYYGSSIESVIRSILPEAVRTEDNSAKTRRIATATENIDPAELAKLEKRAAKQYAILFLLINAPDRTLPVADLGESSPPTLKSLAAKAISKISNEDVIRDR